MRWLSRMWVLVRRSEIEKSQEDCDRQMLRAENWERACAAAEQREADAHARLDEICEFVGEIHESIHPDQDVPECRMECLRSICRAFAAEVRDGNRLTAKLIESDKTHESVVATQEMVAEIRDLLAGDAIELPPSAATTVNSMVAEFTRLANEPVPSPPRGLHVSRSHFAEWADALRSVFVPQAASANEPPAATSVHAFH